MNLRLTVENKTEKQTNYGFHEFARFRVESRFRQCEKKKTKNSLPQSCSFRQVSAFRQRQKEREKQRIDLKIEWKFQTFCSLTTLRQENKAYKKNYIYHTGY